MKNGLHVETLAVHAGEPPCPATGALDTPVYMSSTFVTADTDQMAAIFSEARPGYVYNRYGNPTVKALEDKMAALEGGEAGVATASGMAAISSAILSWVNSGHHVVAAREIYGAAYNFIDKKLPRMGVERTFAASSDASEFEKALRPNTKLIYFETPTNPVLQVVDIAAVARLGRERGIPTVMDNTFATPVLQRPLDYGVDVVVHSATKYLGGHGDAMGGLIVGRRDYARRVYRDILRDYGGIMSPFNAWLILRGIRTLPLRMQASCANADKIALFLESHPKVARVNYPGSESHPERSLAEKQMKAFGAMISFEMKGGYQAGRKVTDSVQIFSRAASLGDTRSLILHPAASSHAAVPREERLKIGIADGLVRLSVGIESPEDLIRDLDRALAA